MSFATAARTRSTSSSRPSMRRSATIQSLLGLPSVVAAAALERERESQTQQQQTPAPVDRTRSITSATSQVPPTVRRPPSSGRYNPSLATPLPATPLSAAATVPTTSIHSPPSFQPALSHASSVTSHSQSTTGLMVPPAQHTRNPAQAEEDAQKRYADSVRVAREMDETAIHLFFELERASAALTKEQAVRVAKWCVKLSSISSATLSLQKDKETYLRLLLDQVVKRDLHFPFDKLPPDGVLPRLPVYLNLHRPLPQRKHDWHTVLRNLSATFVDAAAQRAGGAAQSMDHASHSHTHSSTSTIGGLKEQQKQQWLSQWHREHRSPERHGMLKGQGVAAPPSAFSAAHAFPLGPEKGVQHEQPHIGLGDAQSSFPLPLRRAGSLRAQFQNSVMQFADPGHQYHDHQSTQHQQTHPSYPSGHQSHSDRSSPPAGFVPSAVLQDGPFASPTRVRHATRPHADAAHQIDPTSPAHTKFGLAVPQQREGWSESSFTVNQERAREWRVENEEADPPYDPSMNVGHSFSTSVHTFRDSHQAHAPNSHVARPPPSAVPTNSQGLITDVVLANLQVEEQALGVQREQRQILQAQRHAREREDHGGLTRPSDLLRADDTTTTAGQFKPFQTENISLRQQRDSARTERDRLILREKELEFELSVEKRERVRLQGELDRTKHTLAMALDNPQSFTRAEAADLKAHESSLRVSDETQTRLVQRVKDLQEDLRAAEEREAATIQRAKVLVQEVRAQAAESIERAKAHAFLQGAQEAQERVRRDVWREVEQQQHRERQEAEEKHHLGTSGEEGEEESKIASHLPTRSHHASGSPSQSQSQRASRRPSTSSNASATLRDEVRSTTEQARELQALLAGFDKRGTKDGAAREQQQGHQERTDDGNQQEPEPETHTHTADQAPPAASTTSNPLSPTPRPSGLRPPASYDLSFLGPEYHGTGSAYLSPSGTLGSSGHVFTTSHDHGLRVWTGTSPTGRTEREVSPGDGGLTGWNTSRTQSSGTWVSSTARSFSRSRSPGGGYGAAGKTTNPVGENHHKLLGVSVLGGVGSSSRSPSRSERKVFVQPLPQDEEAFMNYVAHFQAQSKAMAQSAKKSSRANTPNDTARRTHQQRTPTTQPQFAVESTFEHESNSNILELRTSIEPNQDVY